VQREILARQNGFDAFCELCVRACLTLGAHWRTSRRIFLARRSPLQRRSKVRVRQKPLQPELDFPITQSARRDLLRFKQVASAVSQISESCPEFRTGASISGENRWFQTIASKVIGEIAVRIPTSFLPVSLIEESAVTENTRGSISDFRTKPNPCGQNI
jgi:hypothetical protein